jgi:hypothetical protein
MVEASSNEVMKPMAPPTSGHAQHPPNEHTPVNNSGQKKTPSVASKMPLAMIGRIFAILVSSPPENKMIQTQ